MHAWKACQEELQTQLHPIAVRVKREASRRLTAATSASTETDRTQSILPPMKIKVEPDVRCQENISVRRQSGDSSTSSQTKRRSQHKIGKRALPRLKLPPMRIKFEPNVPRQENIAVHRPTTEKKTSSRLKIEIKDDAPSRLIVRKIRRAADKNILPTVKIRVDAGISRQKNKSKLIFLPTVIVKIDRERKRA